jgi:hypothetical protein
MAALAEQRERLRDAMRELLDTPPGTSSDPPGVVQRLT